MAAFNHKLHNVRKKLANGGSITGGPDDPPVFLNTRHPGNHDISKYGNIIEQETFRKNGTPLYESSRFDDGTKMQVLFNPGGINDTIIGDYPMTPRHIDPNFFVKDANNYATYDKNGNPIWHQGSPPNEARVKVINGNVHVRAKGGKLKKKPEFVKRLENDEHPNVLLNNGDIATHLLSQVDNYAIPLVQPIDYNNTGLGYQVIQDGFDAARRAFENNDALRFNSDADAERYTEMYKNYYPNYFSNADFGSGYVGSAGSPIQIQPITVTPNGNNANWYGNGGGPLVKGRNRSFSKANPELRKLRKEATKERVEEQYDNWKNYDNYLINDTDALRQYRIDPILGTPSHDVEPSDWANNMYDRYMGGEFSLDAPRYGKGDKKYKRALNKEIRNADWSRAAEMLEDKTNSMTSDVAKRKGYEGLVPFIYCAALSPALFAAPGVLGELGSNVVEGANAAYQGITSPAAINYLKPILSSMALYEASDQTPRIWSGKTATENMKELMFSDKFNKEHPIITDLAASATNPASYLSLGAKGLEYTGEIGKQLLKLPQRLAEMPGNARFINRANNYFLGYDKIPKWKSISTRLTNDAVKKRIAEHNTYVRGIRDKESITPIVASAIGKSPKDVTREDRLKYMATYYAGDTGHGRFGFDGLPEDRGIIYTSNSLDTGFGYAAIDGSLRKIPGEGDGAVAVVRRPYKLGKDRDKWFEEGDIPLVSTDEIRPKEHLYVPYFLSMNFDGMPNDMQNTVKQFIVDKYKAKYPDRITAPETINSNNSLEYEYQKVLRLLQKENPWIDTIDDAQYYAFADFINNTKFLMGKPIIRDDVIYTTERQMSPETLEKLGTMINSSNRFVRKKGYKHLNELYQHYIFIGPVGESGLDFVRFVEPSEHSTNKLTRSHVGGFTPGLSRKQFNYGGILANDGSLDNLDDHPISAIKKLKK